MSVHIATSPIAALVAAAGLSRRMGVPKQLLPWAGRTVIATVADHLAAAGAAPVLCITGHRSQEVAAALAGTPAQTCFNPDYAQAEMVRSYQIGIEALLTSHCSGVLIALGDQPHIPVSVICQVLDQARGVPDQLVIPSFNLRRGHPFYIPRRLWAELLALGPDETLRALVNRHATAICYVTVETDAILRDLDTPEEFRELQNKRDE
jgi:molybdenum cofactor cytidylyltransferase